MKTLLLLGLGLFAFTAFAQGDHMGGHDGGGGKGLICYDEKGNITSAELLDLYEGRTLESYEIPEYTGTYKEIYQQVIKKSAHESIRGTMEATLKLESGFKFLPKGIRLNSVDDSSEIFIPANCKLEQVANFQGLSRIFVVKDFWDKFSETSKAALIMHESLWYMEREAGAKKSSRARRTVARYFASNFDFEPIDLTIKPGDVICMSTSGPNRRITNSFVLSQTGPQACEVTFAYLGGARSFTKQTGFMEGCERWNFNTFYREGDTTRSDYFIGASSMVDVMAYPEQIMSHQATISFEIKRSPTTGKPVSNFFTIEVQNEEFPGFDTPKEIMGCHVVDEHSINHEWWY